MSVEPDALYALLPTLYRRRDEEQGGVLRQFLAVLTDELAAVADGIDQLYDDEFVETAAPWVLPYLAELIGLRGLPSGAAGLASRAEVANTIGYRRRKGTAAVLEQVARDVSGWPAHAVEYFELIAATQHVNHVRPGNAAYAPIRDARRMAAVGTAFERLPGHPDLTHTVEVRRIGSRRGRYNIPNVGVVSWRLRAYPLTASPLVLVDPRRFRFHPLGIDAPLFVLPVTEDAITQLTGPVNVPHPLGRREFADAVATFYGPGLSVHVPGVEPDQIDVCDLSDTVDGAGTPIWAHVPTDAARVSIDPVLGRVAFGTPPQAPVASCHFGFGADLGGGQYRRPRSGTEPKPVVLVSQQDPAAVPTLNDALTTVAGTGTIEITDSGRYGPVENLGTGQQLQLRARDGARPLLELAQDWQLTGDGEITLSGLLITGGTLRIGGLRAVRLEHCTLVPGLTFGENGAPTRPEVPSVVVTSGDTTLTIERCILGGIRAHPDADVIVRDSIIDAGTAGIAYAAEPDENEPDANWGGGRLTLAACTVLGPVHARSLELVSNSILFSPVVADRRQEGCVRFSYLPPGSRTPRRHRCQPGEESDAARVRPLLVSARYPDPAYGQLDRRTRDEVARGADDESEMGAFHHLFTPNRADYLAARLDDYLRFGLEAGFFFAS